MPPRPSIPIPLLRRGAHAVRAPPVAAAAASVPPPIPPAETPTRVYPARKQFLWAYYTHLLTSSNVVLLFAHGGLDVPMMVKIRNAIAAVPAPLPPSLPSPPTLTSLPASDPEDSPPPAPTPVKPIKAKLLVTRTGLLAALTKPGSPLTPRFNVHNLLKGPTGIITCPSLSPSYVAKLLTTIERTIKQIRKKKGKADGDRGPRLELVAAVLEGGKVMTPAQTLDMTKLPELDTLRAQLIGLLESSGSSLVGVLGQAGGGGLVRTLKGLEKDLQEKSGADANAPSS